MSGPTEGPLTLRWSVRTGPGWNDYEMRETEFATMPEAVSAAFRMYTNNNGTPACIATANGFIVYKSDDLRPAWLTYYARHA